MKINVIKKDCSQHPNLSLLAWAEAGSEKFDRNQPAKHGKLKNNTKFLYEIKTAL